MINSIKRSLITLILIAGFCALVIVITMPLRAELRFNAAEKLAAAYKWKDADAAFGEAIKIDPFSARYLAGFGDFLVLQAKYQDQKALMLGKAEELYRKALELNPRGAEYYLEIGLIELNKKTVGKAFENFRKAVENNPNGFNIAYSIGYAGIGSWKEMNEPDKEFVLDRLRYCLKIKPWHGKHIYLKAWRVTGDFRLLQKMSPDDLKSQQALYSFIVSNNLWQFRKEQAAKVESCGLQKVRPDRQAQAGKIKKMILEAEKLSEANAWKMVNGKWQMAKGGEAIIAGNKVRAERRGLGMVAPGDWAAVSKDGKKIGFNKGAMYSNGTIYALIDIPEGRSALNIEAKGSVTDGIWPYMIVELDGEDIGETFVDSVEFKGYEFGVTSSGTRLLGVSFVNDGSDKDKKEDRNLWVGKAEVKNEIASLPSVARNDGTSSEL